jgi:uncharacterized protein YecE (DUF72 family)
VFYPHGLAQARELAYAAERLPTIEINGSFYSLQRPSSYAAWHAQTPPAFVFAVKGNRFLTHMLKLRDAETPLANILASGVFALREKLGPFLWQLPPQLRFERERMERFLSLLPHDTAQALALARRHDDKLAGRALLEIDAVRPLRHAVEVRHESFRDPDFLALLRAHNVALVVADTAGKWPDMDDVTADFVYIRLHGEQELYASGYDDAALERWAGKIREWARGGDVYCYFDNDIKVRAPFDALRLIDMTS